MLRDLVMKNRSYRRFDQRTPISRDELVELVDLARCSPSGMNLQPLRYRLVYDAETNAAVFDCLAWAGYLKDWPGPPDGERPTAYVIVLGDTQLTKTFGCDHGIACQTMLLGAAEKGYGGCMIGSINHRKLQEALAIPERYQILLVVALGKPVEEIVLEEAEGGDIHYYRDDSQKHHVPKRPLDELILD